MCTDIINILVFSVCFCSICSSFIVVYFSRRYEKLLNEMLNHLERQPRNKDRRIVWLTHINPLFNGVGLVLLAHFRRIFPLFFKWIHADDDETVLLVRVISVWGQIVIMHFTSGQGLLEVFNAYIKTINLYMQIIDSKL